MDLRSLLHSYTMLGIQSIGLFYEFAWTLFKCRSISNKTKRPQIEIACIK